MNTTAKEATGETPFWLVYGTKVVLPVEIGSESLWAKLYDLEMNEETQRQALDFLTEVREAAHLRFAAYQSRVSRATTEKSELGI